MKQYSYIELAKIANIEQRLREKQDKNTVDNGLTEEEVQLLLEWTVWKTREILIRCLGGINIEELDLQGACKLSQTIIYKIFTNIGLIPICLTLSNILDDNYDGEDHKFNIIDFPIINGNKKSFLIDVTYKQFLRDDIPLVTDYWNMQLERKKVLQSFLTNGYLELTPENLKLYGDIY